MRLGLSSLLLLSAFLLPAAAHADVYNFTLSCGCTSSYDSSPYTETFTFSIDTVNDPSGTFPFAPDFIFYGPLASGIVDTYTPNGGSPSTSNPPAFVQIGTTSGSQFVGMGEVGFNITNGVDFFNGTTFVPNAPGTPYLTTRDGSDPFTLNIVDAGPSVATTPEPSSLALLGTGALGVFGMVRRRFNS